MGGDESFSELIEKLIESKGIEILKKIRSKIEIVLDTDVLIEIFDRKSKREERFWKSLRATNVYKNIKVIKRKAGARFFTVRAKFRQCTISPKE